MYMYATEYYIKNYQTGGGICFLSCGGASSISPSFLTGSQHHQYIKLMKRGKYLAHCSFWGPTG